MLEYIWIAWLALTFLQTCVIFAQIHLHSAARNSWNRLVDALMDQKKDMTAQRNEAWDVVRKVELEHQALAADRDRLQNVVNYFKDVEGLTEPQENHDRQVGVEDV